MGLAISLKKMLIGRAFTTERGRIKLFGQTDWTMTTSESLSVLFQDIGEKNGEEYLFHLGYKAGKAGVDEVVGGLVSELSKSNMKKEMVFDLLEFIGVGKPDFIKKEIGKNSHHIIIHMRDNPVIEHAKILYGKNSNVCSFFRGLYSVYGEVLFQAEKTHLKEIKCITKGAPFCIWESKR